MHLLQKSPWSQVAQLSIPQERHSQLEAHVVSGHLVTQSPWERSVLRGQLLHFVTSLSKQLLQVDLHLRHWLMKGLSTYLSGQSLTQLLVSRRFRPSSQTTHDLLLIHCLQPLRQGKQLPLRT